MSRPKKSDKVSETKTQEPIINASAGSQEPEQAKEETQANEELEQGAPFEENVPAPQMEEAFSLEPKKDEVFSLEPTKEDLPSLDEIKAKERALRKR